MKLFKPLDPALPDASPISGLQLHEPMPSELSSTPFNRDLTNMAVKMFLYNYNLDFFTYSIKAPGPTPKLGSEHIFLSMITVCSVVMIKITI